MEAPEDRLLELLGEAEGNQNSLGALETSGGVPRDCVVVQPGLEGLETSARRGGRSIRGTRENREGCGPGLGLWRRIGDETRIQSPHRLDSRPLDLLARRHWVQLGLSHRRPIHPALQYPVFQLPLQTPLTPGEPQTEGS